MLAGLLIGIIITLCLFVIQMHSPDHRNDLPNGVGGYEHQHK